MKRLLFCLLVFGFAVSTEAQSNIVIVRHAEKAEGGGNDPDLSEAGRARAEALAKMLKDAEIKAIYATEFKRTQETAAPLAQEIGIKVTIRPAKATDFALKLRNTPGNALVVGHSNTIPDLIKEFGIDAPPDIAENEYDNLFVLTLDKKPRLLRLHYP
jgi:broad specificity phosphatase PhoE